MARQRKWIPTSVSVPAGLRARMDAVDEEVNWSSVACRAFEDKLTEIAERKEKKSLEDVAQRLRGSKKKREGALHGEGFERGKWWAEHRAEAEELARLEDLYEGGGWERWFEQERGDDSCAWNLLQTLDGGSDARRRRLQSQQERRREFWVELIEATEQQQGSPAYVRGFAEGALAVWLAVKDEL